MSMMINPNNFGSPQEIKKYGDFKTLKGYVDKASDTLKALDNDDKIDLSPAKGNVAVADYPVLGSNVKSTGTLTFSPETGNASKLDLESQSRAGNAFGYEKVTTRLTFTQGDDSQIYDFQKRVYVSDELSGLDDTTKFHWKYTVNNNGTILFENLPYQQ